MKLLKILLGLVLVLVIAVGGVGYFLSGNLPEIIKEQTSVQVPKITGTEASLGDISIIYGTGRVVLSDLVIGNPAKFKTPHAFKLGKLAFQINIPSVFEDAIVIDEFTISGVSIFAEQVGTSTKTNLQQIADHAQKQGKQSQREAAKEEQEGSSSGPEVKLIVKLLKIEANTIDLVSEHGGDSTIEMPDIVLKDLGKQEGGLTPEQLTQRIIEELSDEASDAAYNELKERAKGKLSEKIKEKWNSLFD